MQQIKSAFLARIKKCRKAKRSLQMACGCKKAAPKKKVAAKKAAPKKKVAAKKKK